MRERERREKNSKGKRCNKAFFEFCHIMQVCGREGGGGGRFLYIFQIKEPHLQILISDFKTKNLKS